VGERTRQTASFIPQADGKDFQGGEMKRFQDKRTEAKELLYDILAAITTLLIVAGLTWQFAQAI
jgi:hypothetical protein